MVPMKNIDEVNFATHEVRIEHQCKILELFVFNSTTPRFTDKNLTGFTFHDGLLSRKTNGWNAPESILYPLLRFQGETSTQTTNCWVSKMWIFGCVNDPPNVPLVRMQLKTSRDLMEGWAERAQSVGMTNSSVNYAPNKPSRYKF